MFLVGQGLYLWIHKELLSCDFVNQMDILPMFLGWKIAAVAEILRIAKQMVDKTSQLRRKALFILVASSQSTIVNLLWKTETPS